MENEEREERGYFFRNLIVKILLVLLFVFLLMWLFPMPNLNPFYDKIFTENISNMTDAAKGYFTTSRLPAKEGESKTLTLREMLDNKMLIEFTDSEGKTCDLDKSYVQVTKENGEYVFKTNLSCPSQEDYVIEYFGCYDVCSDGSCKEEKPTTETKEITEYQFSKVNTVKLIDKYLCSDGYTLSGTKCILKTSVETVTDAELKCLNGYTYNSITKKCEKQNIEKFDASKTCPEGYIYASSTNTCIKTSSNTVAANVSYKCENGTLSGNRCLTTIRTIVDAYEAYTCDRGVLSGTSCIVTTINEVPATPVYTCDEGTLSGTKCIISKGASISSYKCSSGTLKGTKCEKTTTSTSSETCSYGSWKCSNKSYSSTRSTSSTTTSKATYKYRTSGGSYVYEVCTRSKTCSGGGTTTRTTTTDATPVYTCESGYTLSGSTCTKTVDARLTSYKCSQGTLNANNKCDVPVVTRENAVKGYVCTRGTLNGTQCISESYKEENAQKVYSCTVGTLNGTVCSINGIATTNTVYTCPFGILSGNSCLVTTTDKVDPSYVCKEGYTKVGNSCYKTSTTNEIKDATVTYKTSTKTVYKWSTSKTLDGWTRTGKTRTTTVAVTSK